MYRCIYFATPRLNNFATLREAQLMDLLHHVKQQPEASIGNTHANTCFSPINFIRTGQKLMCPFSYNPYLFSWTSCCHILKQS